MQRLLSTGARVETGTPTDLIDAAGLGARIAVRARRARGQDDEAIRREIIARFRADLADDGYGEMEKETLMAAVQNGVEHALAERS